MGAFSRPRSRDREPPRFPGARLCASAGRLAGGVDPAGLRRPARRFSRERRRSSGRSSPTPAAPPGCRARPRLREFVVALDQEPVLALLARLRPHTARDASGP